MSKQRPHYRVSTCVICGGHFSHPRTGRARLLCGSKACESERRKRAAKSPRRWASCKCSVCGHKHRWVETSDADVREQAHA